MKNDLTTLQFQRTDNGDEYGFAVARTEGRWHIVRKQYGDNAATYSYAYFRSEAEAYAVWGGDLNAAAWHADPPSNVDFSILLQGMTAPLPSSSSTGAVSTGAATAEAQQRNYGELVKLNSAQASLNEDGTLKLQNPLPVFVTNASISSGGEMQTSNGATETTLAAVRSQLAGTLTVHVANPVAAATSVEVSNFPEPVTNIAVSNFPAPVTTVSVDNLPDKLWPDTQSVSGTFWQAKQPVSLDAVPLAANAATAALQMTGNGTLADISAKLGSTLSVSFPGTQPVAGTVQVGNFPTSQRVTVDNPATTVSVSNFPAPVTSVTVSNLPTTQPVSLATNTPDVTDRAGRLLGHVTVDNQPTSLAITNLPAVQAVSGQVGVSNFPAVQRVTVDNPTSTVAISNFPATQPVTLATNTPDVTDRPARQLGRVTIDSPTGLTDTQLRAAPVPVSGFPTTYPVIGTFWQATQPVSAAALPLPTGASTAALQATGNGYLATLASTGFTATVANSAATPFSLVVATGNNPTSVKSGATQLTGLVATNAASSYRYLMLYNLAAAPATGATPLLTIGVPPGQSVTLPIQSSKYLAFSAGLALAVGTGPALGTLLSGVLGGTGVTANDMVINLTYA